MGKQQAKKARRDQAASARFEAGVGPPSALRRAATALLAAVLAFGLYTAGDLTWHHDQRLYGDEGAELENCPETETLSCEEVNTSAYSEVAGVPIAAFAIPTYLTILGLAVAGLRRPRTGGYAFSIAAATVLHAGYLFYISKFHIGFVCLYCLKLYAVNGAAAVLTAVAAGRSPLALLRETFADLLAWPASLRWTAGAFALLAAVTVGAEQVWRTHLVRTASSPRARAERPGATPARPDGKKSAAPPAAARGADGGTIAVIVPGSAVTVPGALRVLSGSKARVAYEPFDLQARLGQGKGVGLLFWAPGFASSERAVIALTAWLRTNAPGLELFTVAGRRADTRPEVIWEALAMLPLGDAPPPALVDEDFVLSKALGATAVPNLVLIDGAGKLVVTGLERLSQELTAAAGASSGEELVRRVATGAAQPPVPRVAQFYPSSELVGGCAPAFTLPDLRTGKDYAFAGKSARGRPTLIVFWSATCKHCQKELPALAKHWQAHRDEYDVVTITRLKRPKAGGGPNYRAITLDYARAQGLEWPLLEDPGGAVAERYGVVSTPTTLHVAANGEVKGAWYFANNNLDDAMQRLLPTLRAGSLACKPRAEEPRPTVELTLTDANGQPVQLSKLADRPTLLHFWATWCEPCKKELPSLVKFASQLEKAGGRVVFLSVEGREAADAVRAYPQRAGLTFSSHLAPEGPLADKVDLSYKVPRTYLLGRGGTLLENRLGTQDWEDPAIAAEVLSRLFSLP